MQRMLLRELKGRGADEDSANAILKPLVQELCDSLGGNVPRLAVTLLDPAALGEQAMSALGSEQVTALPLQVALELADTYSKSSPLAAGGDAGGAPGGAAAFGADGGRAGAGGRARSMM